MKPGFRRAPLVLLALGSIATLSGCIVVVGNTSRGAYQVESLDGRSRRIGVELEPTSRALAAQAGLKADDTCVIHSVISGSPADRAGLKRYDVITGIQGQQVASIGSLRQAVRDTAPGQTLMLQVLRAGQPVEIAVTVAEARDWDN